MAETKQPVGFSRVPLLEKTLIHVVSDTVTVGNKSYILSSVLWAELCFPHQFLCGSPEPQHCNMGLDVKWSDQVKMRQLGWTLLQCDVSS